MGGPFRPGGKAGGWETSSERRTVPFAHPQEQRQLPAKVLSEGKESLAVAASSGTRTGTARRPRAQPDHLPYRGAGRHRAAGPRRCSSPRWRAHGDRPPRITLAGGAGGAGRLRAQPGPG